MNEILILASTTQVNSQKENEMGMGSFDMKMEISFEESMSKTKGVDKEFAYLMTVELIMENGRMISFMGLELI